MVSVFLATGGVIPVLRHSCIMKIYTLLYREKVEREYFVRHFGLVSYLIPKKKTENAKNIKKIHRHSSCLYHRWAVHFFNDGITLFLLSLGTGHHSFDEFFKFDISFQILLKVRKFDDVIYLFVCQALTERR